MYFAQDRCRFGSHRAVTNQCCKAPEHRRKGAKLDHLGHPKIRRRLGRAEPVITHHSLRPSGLIPRLRRRQLPDPQLHCVVLRSPLLLTHSYSTNDTIGLEENIRELDPESWLSVGPRRLHSMWSGMAILDAENMMILAPSPIFFGLPGSWARLKRIQHGRRKGT